MIGEMDQIGSYCNALKFAKDPPGMCCSNGKTGSDSKFLQIYFMGNTEMEIDIRCSLIQGTRRPIIEDLQKIFIYITIWLNCSNMHWNKCHQMNTKLK